ncbi:hypothetical protein Acid345_3644 [Candidatus Koribacter versatilis Ellin345]|uniref:Uncharacterized protein n=1 Tax=Koribacter versatilis (strain Ellin345) TaxID=204669 RepID=Q1IKF5_KORVE|nr:hypothetical protein [Candidatus Koribacter versatilis]ABF42645.1 hypothetical protein Acid345_3644 [Candidatus Koribacter versatilis Ellin345]
MPRAFPNPLRLVLVWLIIEFVACSFVVLATWKTLHDCKQSPCANEGKAMIWDARRGFAAVITITLLQPIGSAFMLSALSPGETRAGHLGKAVLVGALFVLVSSLVGWAVYSSYARPALWSLGNIFVEIFVTVPILQGLSALIGGISCGMIDWKFRGQPAHS